MREQLLLWLIAHDYPHNNLVVNIIMLIMIVLTTLLLHAIIHHGLFRYLSHKLKASKAIFLNVLAEQKLFSNMAFAIQGILLAIQLRIWLPESVLRDGLLNLTYIWCLIYVLLSIFALLDTTQSYLNRRNIGQSLPMGGLVQWVKLMAATAIGVLLISLLLGQSPLVLLSGLGAMTAVLMLVFKDPILGLVGGILLSANRMLKIGDWLEMPKYGADGDVIDIGLTTVKVKNWDNTITTLPTYSLISDSFINWRSMTESGGRRIKRAVYLDSSSVGFMSEQEIAYLNQSRLLTDYLTHQQQQVQAFNQAQNIDSPGYQGQQGFINRRLITLQGAFYGFTSPDFSQNRANLA